MNLVRKTRARLASAVITVLLLLAAAFMIAPAEWASGATGFQTARFKIEIKGVQKTVQQHTHTAEGQCDLTDISSGSEKIVFKTRPIVITASHAPGQFNPYLLARATPQGIPATATATVSRSYTPRIRLATDPECGRNGGGSVEIHPDCGTRTVGAWRLDLEYDQQRKNGVFLAADEGPDLFAECPAAGDMLAFPFLDTTTTAGKTITAQVSQDELFDPGIGKWVAIAKGSRRYDAPDYWAKATVEWDVSFTRLKGP
ncbi:MAG TPA: hypothetical protein VMF55_15660 [Solirubrobacterales bacterium]|nr:hypothetical protein [Solirubrobacterales bacterium]